MTLFIRLDKAISKNIYKEARSKVEIISITQNIRKNIMLFGIRTHAEKY